MSALSWPAAATLIVLLAAFSSAQIQTAHAVELAEEILVDTERTEPCDPLSCASSLLECGRYAEAERLARDLLTLGERNYGPKSECMPPVLNILVEALWRGGKASGDETLKLAQRLVRVTREVFGANHEEVASSLNQLACVYGKRGDIDKARKCYERGLAILRQSPVSNTVVEAAIHHNLAGILVHQGKYSEAERHYLLAIELEEQEFGPDHARIAGTLRSLAGLLADTGDYNEAWPLYERAVRIAENEFGPDGMLLGDRPNRPGFTGAMLLDLEAYSEAQEQLERALEAAEERYGADNPKVATILGNLGIVYIHLGDPRAESCLRRAASLVEESDPVQAAVWLENLALLIRAKDHGTARRYHERALGLFEASYGPRSARVAWVHHGLGNLLSGIGDYQQALHHHQQSERIYEDSVGSRSWLTMGAMEDLAASYARLGRYDEGRAVLHDLLRTQKALYGTGNVELAGTVEQMARLERRAGDQPAARALCEQARAIRENGGPQDGGIPAGSLKLYAEVQVDEGDLEEARRLFGQAVASKKKADVEGDQELGEILVELAEVDWRLGEVEDACGHATQAEAITRHHFLQTIPSLSEREALTYAEVRASGLDLILSIAVEEPTFPVDTAWDSVIRSRALVLDEMSNRNRTVVVADDPQLQDLVDQLRATRTHIANLAVRGMDDGQIRQLYHRIRQDKERLERELSERSLAFRLERERQGAGFAEVHRALPSGSGLVSFVRYHEVEQDEAGLAAGRPRPRNESYLAFVLRDDEASPIVVPLGPAGNIESDVIRLRRAIANVAMAPSRASQRAEASFRSIAEDLRRAVWDPVAPDLEGVDRIFVVPDGALNLINFAVLPSSDSRYLAEVAPPIHYLSAERDLVVGDDLPAGRGLLAVGDPAFDEASFFAVLRRETEEITLNEDLRVSSAATFRGARSSCGDFRSLRFEQLPESNQEVDRVVELWQQHAAHHRRLRGVVTGAPHKLALSGTKANEASFKAVAPGRLVLHVATHGFFLGENCPSILGPGEINPDQRQSALIHGENPLLLSGLALAGANHRNAATPEEEDGILTAEEIAALDLTGVEWAVLSACDTGVGSVRTGEGVFGLRRAFQVAGVRTLIMSLWPVDDEVSREWMQRLYENRLAEGLSTADSVHWASLTLLEERRSSGSSTHPFFWAGFIASGDWR
jgi:CHAT domain-containing protein/tetratricopeptide (TPR) repeat protein